MISTLSHFIAKRRLRANLFNINAFLQTALMLIIVIASSRADANRHQTNKNDISNLFNQEVEDRQGLDKFLENSRKESEQGVAGQGAVQALGAQVSELEGKHRN